MSESIKNPTLIDPDMKEIVESFIVETKEILEKLDVDLLELERKPDDKELLNQIFRSFHTIKGTSGFLGLVVLPEVTHKCEDILNKLRKGEAFLSTDLMDGILLAFDTIKRLITQIETEQNESVETEKVCLVLEGLLNEIDQGRSSSESNKDILPEEILAKIEAEEKKATVALETPLPEKHHEEKKVDAIEKTMAASQVKENTIRVDVDRLDALLDIVSELVLGRNRLTQVNSQFTIQDEGNRFAKDFGEVTKQIDLMTTELQLVSMKLRMIKIAKIFNRYPRMVRDLSKDLSKEVELVIRG